MKNRKVLKNKSLKFKEKVTKTKGVLFTVSYGKKEIGRAFLYLIYNKLHKKPYGLLEDVFVKEEFRGQGIGGELVKRVINKAKELGCYKLIATSRFERKSVHNFYKKLGFKKWGYEFRIDF